MLLIPFTTRHLESDLPPAALAAALRPLVAKGEGAAFTGRVSQRGLTITGMRAFRSTVLPVLTGTFAPRNGGTSVRLRLRPPRTVFVFMGIWLLFLAVVAVGIVKLGAPSGDASLLPLLVPAGLAGFSWHLMAGVFSADARWALEHLLERAPMLRLPGGTPWGGRASMVRRDVTGKGEPHARM